MAKSKKKKKGGSKKLKKSNLVLASPTALTNIARNEARRKLEPEIKRIEQELIQKEKEMEDLVYQGLFVKLLGIPLLALRNRGYGKKRLEEFYKRMDTGKEIAPTFTDVEVIYFRYDNRIYRLDKEGVRSRTYGQTTIPLELFENDRTEIEVLEIHFFETIEEEKEEKGIEKYATVGSE